nr:ricin-type beta-trefoil lectin domain protein [Streptomyces actuosus]
MTAPVVSLASIALIATAVHPEPVTGQNPRTAPVADSYDGFDAGSAEQVRQDQCLMAGVLRRGGPHMFAIGQKALGQPPLPADELHALADRQYWNDTPLSKAFEEDRDGWDEKAAKLGARKDVWQEALSGLETPGGYTVAGFHRPPGSPNDGKEDFFTQTGLGPWIGQRWWTAEDSYYADPTTKADDKTKAAFLALGTKLYGGKDDWSPGGVPYEEWRGWQDYVTSGHRVWADDARIFLGSGGFPKAAPRPGTLPFRVAVEDLKARFAGCNWHNPVDPDKVLGKEVRAASEEWQSEVADQATQRKWILAANRKATDALAAGAQNLGEAIAQSWIADHLTHWLDYWSPGGAGWLGDAPVVMEFHAAKGKCLDVEGNNPNNGTPVQIHTCNGTAAQKWVVYGDDSGLHVRSVGTQKCLDVRGNNAANGTKIEIWSCKNNPPQTWKFSLNGTTSLKNVGTGKCLDVHTYDQGYNAWLWGCNGTGPQQLDVKPTGHNGTDGLGYPDKAQFTKANTGITRTQAAAKKQLDLINAQVKVADQAVKDTDANLAEAYRKADARGVPRGRGLIVGMQKAQVTKASAAALHAMAKAAETAYQATKASAGDSTTVADRAKAQAAASKAAFRRAAAQEADAQAKAAADAAAHQAETAKDQAGIAKAKLADATQAEADAKAAAATAHAKRLAAEAQEKTAKAQKATAAAKQAEAAQHKKNAQAQATAAQQAQTRAEQAQATAATRRGEAEKAADHARAKRDDAWDAEQKADAARAKADAKAAYADSLDASDAATAAREAADAADAAATTAETAAGKARTEADAATKAAADADAAATRAEAAAKRARSDADAAQAAKLKTDAAVATATSAAADAIKAAQTSATSARTAVHLADEAEQHAKTATTQADGAKAEAAKALTASAQAAGHAYITAQAADDARHSAAQVAAPANDAVELGSPYADTDSAAGLAVLTGQASKTIAEQQLAVAQAHADNAAQAASAAQALADKATGDTKAAYTAAASAARHAVDARKSAKAALGYAADAADYAAQASDSLTRTLDYQHKASADADAADKAATGAEGYAKQARDSADQAATDAAAAREAAAAAEQAAKDARAAAKQADADATAAEQAAKDAAKYAEEAQEAAEKAERAKANQQVSSGAGTGIGGVFYVVDEDTIEITEAKQLNDCVIDIGLTGCKVSFDVTFDVKVDFYLCTNADVPATESGCPVEDTLHLSREPFKGLQKKVTQYFSKLDLIKQTVVYQILKAVLVQDFVDCWHGSVSGCAWAASNFIPGKAFGKVAEAMRALDAALRTGVGVRDALRALKALEEIDPATIARIEGTVNTYEDVLAACRVNSFPGDTRVLMADGSHKAIRDVRTGDLVLADAPQTGRGSAQPVTDTFRHRTTLLVDVTLADGALTSTAGHRLWVDGDGWTRVSELRAGDRLRTPDGTRHTVRSLRTRSDLAPREVFDLSIDGLHSFYVGTAGARSYDVLVHNCTDILADEDIAGAHTLREHVRKTDEEMVRKALDTPGGVATRWADEATAARAVDQAMKEWIKNPKNAQKLEDWKVRQAQRIGKKIGFDPNRDLLPVTWTLKDEGSLGTKWVKDGDRARTSPAGNKVVIKLKYVGKMHKPTKYVVYTSFPEG